MKKWTLLTITFILGIILLTGCGGDAKKETPATTSKQKIVVGLDDQFPPMGFRNEKNEIVGFDIDMAKEASKRMGIEVEFKAIDWASKEAELKSGRVDMLWNGLTMLEERKKNILFSKPYMGNKQIVVIKKGNSITSKDGLKGKVVAVQDDSSAVTALGKEKSVADTFKELKKYPDLISAFLDLGNGRVDVLIVDEVLARYYMSKNPDKYDVINNVDFGTETFGVGMALTNKDLQAKLDKTLDEMKADGTAAKISEKWFGKYLVQ